MLSQLGWTRDRLLRGLRTASRSAQVQVVRRYEGFDLQCRAVSETARVHQQLRSLLCCFVLCLNLFCLTHMGVAWCGCCAPGWCVPSCLDQRLWRYLIPTLKGPFLKAPEDPSIVFFKGPLCHRQDSWG